MEAIDTLELNEGLVLKSSHDDEELIAKLNRWGGAIASGHPYGAEQL